MCSWVVVIFWIQKKIVILAILILKDYHIIKIHFTCIVFYNYNMLLFLADSRGKAMLNSSNKMQFSIKQFVYRLYFRESLVVSQTEDCIPRRSQM